LFGSGNIKRHVGKDREARGEKVAVQNYLHLQNSSENCLCGNSKVENYLSINRTIMTRIMTWFNKLSKIIADDWKFQIFIFLIGYINVNKGVFCLIISYLRIKSYKVLNYNYCSTDWSFPLMKGMTYVKQKTPLLTLIYPIRNMNIWNFQS
jgi:hypothetical protein